jgi:hypothetical protein
MVELLRNQIRESSTEKTPEPFFLLPSRVR